MSDPNAAYLETEKSWLAWLRQRDEQIGNYLSSWLVGRRLTVAELQGIISTLDQHLQELNNQRPAAENLSRGGARNFAQRLDAAIQDLNATRSTYQQMCVSTAATDAQTAGIMQRSNQAQAQIMSDIRANAQAASMQDHQRYIDQMSGSCFICHTPIGIPGGGVCWRCAPRMSGTP